MAHARVHATGFRAAVLGVLAGLVVLVLVAGLPRFLVVCNGPHCENRVEVLHFGDDCCAHGHDQVHGRAALTASDQPDPDGEHVTADTHHDCEDQAFGFGLGPLPTKVRPPLAAAPTIASLALPAAAAPPAAADRAGWLPPANGPPRPPASREHLAATRLLQ